MAAIGMTAFAALLWGALLAVFAVFCYEVYVLANSRGPVG